MKQSKVYAVIQGKMAPGVITRDGFLGEDRRNLVDILTTDDGEARRLGYGHQDIARRMVELRDAGLSGLGEFLDVVGTALGGEMVTTTVEGRERFGVSVRYPRELRDDPRKIATEVLDRVPVRFAEAQFLVPILFDQERRACSAYAARPQTCRDYPLGRRCGYYEFLQFERRLQGDESFVPDA